MTAMLRMTMIMPNEQTLSMKGSTLCAQVEPSYIWECLSCWPMACGHEADPGKRIAWGRLEKKPGKDHSRQHPPRPLITLHFNPAIEVEHHRARLLS
jgi:hypothetical protein